MVSLELFRDAGFFVVEDFITPVAAAHLVAALEDADASAAGVYAGSDDPGEDVRRTKRLHADPVVRASLADELLRLKPGMEEHFDVRIERCELPEILLYEEGDYFRRHADGGPGSSDLVASRKVSVIVFLNPQATDDDEGTTGYTGGDLVLWVGIRGPGSATLPLPFPARPGLLVAFGPHVFHEVKPVTSGRRYTVVSWFH